MFEMKKSVPKWLPCVMPDVTKRFSNIPSSMLMIRKWLDQNLPGAQESQTMRDGRILF
jgi:hypothetical protein